MPTTVSPIAASVSRDPSQYAQVIMAAPPAATGITGMLISRLARALVSSASAKATAIPMYSRNVALTVSSVSTTRPPSTTPTPMAAGRLRPARPLDFSGSLACSGVFGPVAT
jgi:hypothetical protein